MESSIFPFFNITNSELLHLFSPLSCNSLTNLLDTSLSSESVLPALTDFVDPAFTNKTISALSNPNCEYSTVENINLWLTYPSSFSILHINARSLNSNIDKIRQLLQLFNQKPDVITISETWLLPSQPTNLIVIDNYNLISVPRPSKKRGGGVAIYVNSTFEYNVISCASHLLTNNIEMCTIEITNLHS
jgi:hypothetical protein